MPPKDPTRNKRQRRYKRRITKGLEFFRGDISSSDVAAMIKRKILTPEESRNPERLGQAVAELAALQIKVTALPTFDGDGARTDSSTGGWEKNHEERK